MENARLIITVGSLKFLQRNDVYQSWIDHERKTKFSSFGNENGDSRYGPDKLNVKFLCPAKVYNEFECNKKCSDIIMLICINLAYLSPLKASGPTLAFITL